MDMNKPVDVAHRLSRRFLRIITAGNIVRTSIWRGTSRGGGVKFGRGWRYLPRIPAVPRVLCVTYIKLNTPCYRAAVRDYLIETGRLALYDIC